MKIYMSIVVLWVFFYCIWVLFTFLVHFCFQNGGCDPLSIWLGTPRREEEICVVRILHDFVYLRVSSGTSCTFGYLRLLLGVYPWRVLEDFGYLRVPSGTFVYLWVASGTSGNTLGIDLKGRNTC